ncbi:MAG: AAA family ATPase [Ignavibacteriales bacterium]|nr:AAA family ATPase [Ignavibacteriales bacterium]
MLIQSIEIFGFRGFATRQTLNLAMPNGSPGSGLTVLVGPNNAGKSTIIESFHCLTSERKASFSEGRRNKMAGDRVSITITDSRGSKSKLRTIDSGGSQTKWENEASWITSEIFALPSRRYFEPFFGTASPLDRTNYTRNYGAPAVRGAAIHNFGGRLFNVLNHQEQFNKILKKILDPVPDWTIDQTDEGKYCVKVKSNSSYHNSEGMGDGLVSLLFIIDAIYDSNKEGVIVIDEPELSLHPLLQRKLFSLMKEYAKDRQIVLATHSPYFVDFDAIEGGAKLARVHLSGNGSIISELSKSSTSELMKLSGNLNNPHILELHAREVFFLDDRVILVEGQEDVIFYQKILKELGIELTGSFFGWGVGGADNMKIIAAMLKEMGFKKIVGIFDSNKSGLIPSLESEFPAYKFFSIPAEDVRTKQAVSSKSSVEGILDEKHQIREKYKYGMVTLFGSIKNFLQ